MRLYFLRHGEAAERETWTGADKDRPLTPSGIDEMEQVAAGLAALDLGCEVILSSGFARADATAQIAARALGLRVERAEELAPGATLAGLLSVLHAHPDSKRILVVGHEPDFSHMIGELIASPHPANLVLKKAGCARVDLRRRVVRRAVASNGLFGEGTLVWLLTPHDLALIGGHEPPVRGRHDAETQGNPTDR